MVRKKTAAVFDVDGTLVQGGTERCFFLYLWRHRVLKSSKILAFLAHLAASPRERFRNKRYLKGLEVEEMVRLGHRCYRELIVPRLRPRALDCLAKHRKQGRLIILITGSLDFLIQPLMKDLGADRLIATEPAQENGKFTGDLNNLHPRGENKRLLLEKLAHQENLDLSASYAYGDHLEDAAMLQAVGWPVAVNPNRGLKRLALKQGWLIEYF
jgi:HAD superfamily hydrolase (TIGR01490 family)|uniref:HAD family hydrolase n=1 Tax=Desulfobacca acetoxidans TaxID=60893 RepID=A0A7C5ELB1_9BACT